MKPLYGTTLVGTELILDMWFQNEDKAIKELMLHISINKPETVNNNYPMARNAIEAYIQKF
jgi:hypothetical protein